jgi:hypothetical protein
MATTIYVHVSESRDVLFEGDLPNITNAVVKLQDGKRKYPR